MTVAVMLTQGTSALVVSGLLEQKIAQTRALVVSARIGQPNTKRLRLTASIRRPTNYVVQTSSLLMTGSLISMTDNFCYAKGATDGLPLYTTGVSAWTNTSNSVGANEDLWIFGSVKFNAPGIWKIWPVVRIPEASRSVTSGGLRSDRGRELQLRKDNIFTLTLGNTDLADANDAPRLSVDLNASTVRLDESLSSLPSTGDHVLAYAEVVNGALTPFQVDVTNYAKTWFGYIIHVKRTTSLAYQWGLQFQGPDDDDPLTVPIPAGYQNIEWRADKQYTANFGSSLWDGEKAHFYRLGVPRGYQLRVWTSPNLDSPWSGTAQLNSLTVSSGFLTTWVGRTSSTNLRYGSRPTSWATGTTPVGTISYGPTAIEWRGVLQERPTTLGAAAYDYYYAIGLYDRYRSTLSPLDRYRELAFSTDPGMPVEGGGGQFRSRAFLWYFQEARWTTVEADATLAYPTYVLRGDQRLLGSAIAQGLIPAASDASRWIFFLFKPGPTVFPTSFRWRVFLANFDRTSEAGETRPISLTLTLLVVDTTKLNTYGVDAPRGTVAECYLEAPIPAMTML